MQLNKNSFFASFFSKNSEMKEREIEDETE